MCDIGPSAAELVQGEPSAFCCYLGEIQPGTSPSGGCLNALSYLRMMAAYIVGRLQVTHLDWVGEYIPKVSQLIAEHGGRFLVRRGDPVQIEGNEPAPDAAIIIEFPDRDSALRFWNSPEFAPLVELRQTGSHMEATLLDGLS
jgi:uncharacterized protein (DUF1330 family)